MLYRANVLMRGVIAVGTCGGNVDLARGRGRLGSRGIEYCREALAGRRRDAFRRTIITERLVSA